MMLAPNAPAETPSAEESPASTAARPAPGRTGRIVGWLLVIVLLVGIALLSMRFIVTSPDLGGTLNPQSPSPSGAKALAELVRDRGVDVEVTDSRAAAASALRPGTTLVLTDPYTLTDKAVNALLERADRVVLLTSSARMLRLLDLGEDAPLEGGRVDAQCDTPEFARVGDIRAERMFIPSAGADGCFRTESGAAAVVRSTEGGRTVTLVEGARLFSNDALAEDGNAALGLALLAQTERVVWYQPSLSDSDISSDQKSLGSLTPEWVTPAILMLLVAGLAAIWWRGRRFGPLVAESLPVTVRASETMQGRARLTAKAADAAHAGDSIRTGTVIRLSARLALGPRASIEEVADAASDRLGVPRTSLYDLLGGPAPQNDHELIDLARRLADLETAVENTVHIERNRP